MQGKGITKLYYTIGEVSKMTGLETHVLRFWETEFSELRPRKNRAGHRAYMEKDIRIVERIKYLLKERGLTIKGAQQALSAEESGTGSEPVRNLIELRRFLGDVLEQLEAD